jgi:hypothetical protein
VRYLERFPGEGVPAVCAPLRALFVAPLVRSVMAVARTGVGRPVVGLLRQARLGAQLRPVTITACY